MTCPQCARALEPTPLGTLGRLEWFRCRACGWEWSHPAEQLEPTPAQKLGAAVHQAVEDFLRAPQHEHRWETCENLDYCAECGASRNP